MNKFVISSGHGKYIAGAGKYLDEVTEARKVVEKVSQYLKQLNCTVYKFHDDTSKSVTENLRTITNYHNSKTRDMDISVHFNAGGGTGVEVLTYKSNILGSKMSKSIASVLGLKDRGNKVRNDLFVIKNTTKPCLLLEICFVDSKADKDAYEKNFDAMCIEIAETLTGLKVSTPKPVPPLLTKPSMPSCDVVKDTVMYRVVTGSFTELKNANEQIEKLKKLGFNSFVDTYKK